MYKQKHLLNTHSDISSGARGLNLNLSLHLHPCFVYVSSKGSSEPAYLIIGKISCGGIFASFALLLYILEASQMRNF